MSGSKFVKPKPRRFDTAKAEIHELKTGFVFINSYLSDLKNQILKTNQGKFDYEPNIRAEMNNLKPLIKAIKQQRKRIIESLQLPGRDEFS